MELLNYKERDLIKMIIIRWLRENYCPQVTPLMESFLKGNAEAAQRQLNLHLEETIFCHDFLENNYHGFLAGLLIAARGSYRTISNFEPGDGCSDIQIGALDCSTIAGLECELPVIFYTQNV